MNSSYIVVWNITSKCNENCKFCFRKKCNESTLEENKKIFDNLSNIKMHRLTLSGGEPLLYKDLFELVNYIRTKNPSLILTINTNGKIIDDDIMKQIIEKFDIITFSIDSTNDTTNEKIGRGKKHLDKTIKILDMCNNKIKIKINTVVNKYNIDDFEEIYELIKKYSISRWKIFRFLPIRDIDDIASDKVEKIIDTMKLKSNMIINYNKIQEYKTSFFIFPDGSIENNRLQKIGNILDTSITEILKLKENSNL